MATRPVVVSEGRAFRCSPTTSAVTALNVLETNFGVGAAAWMPATRSPSLRTVPLPAAALANCAAPGKAAALKSGPVLVMRRSRQRVFALASRWRCAFARSMRCGKSTAHSWGGR